MQSAARKLINMRHIAASGAPAVILVAEDDDLTRELMATVLKRDGHQIVEAESGVQAIEILKTRPIDLVLSDIQMARVGGMEVLSYVALNHSLIPVILITAFAQPETAMDAISQGATDYLTKPIDVFALRATVTRALENRRAQEETLRRQEGEPLDDGVERKTLIGTSPPMLALYKQLAQVAPTHATVLIMGESGTGKELVARTLHDRSRRSEGSYVAVNCAAFAENILESELFGHERGAFTGAQSVRRGVFEEASGGTLFLDEIGDIPVKMQAQLLRVLQEGEVRRVGGTGTITVDVRVIAATNRDLNDDVAAGRMREDLFYRLNVVTVHTPPLRKRGEDVVELAKYFLIRYANEYGREVPQLSEDAMALIRQHPWPGNVRELENAIARAIALSPRSILTAHDFPVSDPPSSRAMLENPWPTLAELEKRYVAQVLDRTGGNRTHAAAMLGVDRRTLQRMLAKEDHDSD